MVLIIALLTGFFSAVGAEAISIPGTKVAIEPPEGFVLASKFPGLQKAELASSIVITELPAPINTMMSNLTKENLLSRGMTLRSSEEVNFGERTGRLFSVTQSLNGATFEKLLAVFGNSSSTVMVTAAYPQTLASEMRGPIRASVLSANWDTKIKLDPFDGLNFRIQESKHLKIQNRVQNSLILSNSSLTNRASLSEPFAIVASSYSPIHINNVELFARQRITQTAQISDLTEIRGLPRQIANKPAYEILAKAKDLKHGEPLSVYQLVIVEGDTYFMVQGMAPQEQFEDYLPEFRTIAESLEIR